MDLNIFPQRVTLSPQCPYPFTTLQYSVLGYKTSTNGNKFLSNRSLREHLGGSKTQSSMIFFSNRSSHDLLGGSKFKHQ